MTSWQQRYFDRYYSRSRGWVDGTTRFHAMCSELIAPGSKILEVGAGPTNHRSDFLSTLGRVEGIDIDPDVQSNRALSAAHVIDGEIYPLDDDSFDACVSNYVVEHVDDPNKHLAEIGRVLRPGGVYLFLAPNIYHYVSIAAAVTPHWFHRLVANRLRNLPTDSHDPYPTRYRMNSRRAIERAASRCGFEIERLEIVESEPMYGQSSRLLFFPFMAYERLVNSSKIFEQMRANFLVALRKPK